jgi:hypothetical protein
VQFADDASIPVTTMLPLESDVQREVKFKSIEQAMNRLMEEERAVATID